MKKTTSTLLLATVLLGATACNDSGNNDDATSPPPPAVDNAVLDSRYLETAPAEAKLVSAVFANPIPGTEVTVSGEIMGRKEPFVEGRAMFVLGDPTKMTPCNRIHGDACKTPWDACCDSSGTKKGSIATIQFVDENGQVIESGIKGYRGIKEQTFVTVTGTIAEGSSEENLLINASGFHAAKESPYKDAAAVAPKDGQQDES